MSEPAISESRLFPACSSDIVVRPCLGNENGRAVLSGSGWL